MLYVGHSDRGLKIRKTHKWGFDTQYENDVSQLLQRVDEVILKQSKL